jgi:antitoxin component of RelBE/YafQ-DinJ toxin-antitoxin module
LEETITIKIDDEKKTELQRIATSKGLLLSNYVRMILYEAVELERVKEAA